MGCHVMSIKWMENVTFQLAKKSSNLTTVSRAFMEDIQDSKLLIFSLFSITLQILIICTSLIWYGTIVFKRTPFHEWIVQNLEFRKCSLKIYCLSHNFGMLSPEHYMPTLCSTSKQLQTYRGTFSCDWIQWREI